MGKNRVTMQRVSLNFLFFGLLFLLCSCSSGRIITQSDFDCIPMNMPIKEFITNYGQPYKICEKKPGVYEYTYIQKIDAGQGEVIQTNYIFTVINNKICNKRKDTLGGVPSLRVHQ